MDSQIAGRALLEALRDPAVFGAAGPVEMRETHGSWVFLVGERAYKLKKPVKLEFLDYSSRELRLAACREEVRVNQALARDIYLGVAAVIRTPEGLRLAADDPPGAIDHLVIMRRFDEGSTLRGLIEAGRLTRSRVRRAATALAAFHARADRFDGGEPERMRELWRSDVDEIRDLGAPEEWRSEPMRSFGDAFLSRHAQEVGRRVEEGRIRDCHGDLRCEHVLPDPPVRVVDRIEFDPALRHMDVALDLAFLAMDLELRGRRWAATELVLAYEDAGGSAGSSSLQAFYASHWALVRAKVGLIAAADRCEHERRLGLRSATRLWHLAERLAWRARMPFVMVVCGPPASGKSTVARAIAARAGLHVLSSDLVRKAMAGIPRTERGGADLYSPEVTRSVYDRLGRDAVSALERGGAVIVDASCQSRQMRAPLLARLQEARAPLLALRCRVRPETAMRRARDRMNRVDRVSDATPDLVAERQSSFPALDELPAERVIELDCERDPEEQVERAARALDLA